MLHAYKASPQYLREIAKFFLNLQFEFSHCTNQLSQCSRNANNPWNTCS